MFTKTILCLSVAALVAGCEQTPDQVYTPAVLKGKAYVLAAADHIAVVDLASTALTRIKLDKKGLDLAIVNRQLFILAADGSLTSLKNESTLQPWQEGLAGAVAMSAGPNNSLWLLGKKELRQIIPGQGPGQTLPLADDYSSVFQGDGPDTMWLVKREASSVTPINLTTKQLGATITSVGNSVHHGQAFAETGELWLAEGNETMDGKPYGIGYAPPSVPAMPGGINVIDLATGKQTDFIMLGGNVIDLARQAKEDKVYAAISQMPEYTEASLSVINSKTRRTSAELRLCEACHQNEDVTLKRGEGRVLAVAVVE